MVRGPDWRPPTPPKVDLSILQFAKHFKNEEFKPPKVFDIKNGKDKILKDDKFRGRHEAVFYSGGCIVRTTKKGIEKSKQDRREKEQVGRGRDSRKERPNMEYSRRRHEPSTDRFKRSEETRSRRRSRSRSRRKKSQDYHNSDSRRDRDRNKEREDTKREDERRKGEGRRYPGSSSSYRSDSPRRRC